MFEHGGYHASDGEFEEQLQSESVCSTSGCAHDKEFPVREDSDDASAHSDAMVSDGVFEQMKRSNELYEKFMVAETACTQDMCCATRWGGTTPSYPGRPIFATGHVFLPPRAPPPPPRHFFGTRAVPSFTATFATLRNNTFHSVHEGAPPLQESLGDFPLGDFIEPSMRR